VLPSHPNSNSFPLAPFSLKYACSFLLQAEEGWPIHQGWTPSLNPRALVLEKEHRLPYEHSICCCDMLVCLFCRKLLKILTYTSNTTVEEESLWKEPLAYLLLTHKKFEISKKHILDALEGTLYGQVGLQIVVTSFLSTSFLPKP
jgi:hypothetical protein